MYKWKYVCYFKVLLGKVVKNKWKIMPPAGHNKIQTCIILELGMFGRNVNNFFLAELGNKHDV